MTIADPVLSAILAQWSSFHIGISKYRSETSFLADQTDVAMSVATTAESVCQSLEDLRSVTYSISLNLQDELEQLLHDGSEDTVPLMPSPPPSLRTSHLRRPRRAIPPISPTSCDSPFPTCSKFCHPAHKWLLQNLHNPYPPDRVREKITRESSSRRRDVDGWFSYARTKIGWNALRSDHFQDRKNMVHAATVYFRPMVGAGERSLDHAIEYRFFLIKLNAEQLLSNHRCSVTTPEASLDRTAANTNNAGVPVRDVCVSREVVFSYPSPPPSDSGSPELEHPRKKRRAHFEESSDCDVKRRRYDSLSPIGDMASALHSAADQTLTILMPPSPPSSNLSSDDEPDPESPSFSLSRKRSASISEGLDIPIKRPRLHYVGPQSRSVSNSAALPMMSIHRADPSDFDQWLASMFEREDRPTLNDIELTAPSLLPCNNASLPAHAPSSQNVDDLIQPDESQATENISGDARIQSIANSDSSDDSLQQKMLGQRALGNTAAFTSAKFSIANSITDSAAQPTPQKSDGFSLSSLWHCATLRPLAFTDFTSAWFGINGWTPSTFQSMPAPLPMPTQRLISC